MIDACMTCECASDRGEGRGESCLTVYVSAFLLSSVIAKIGMGTESYQKGKRWPTAAASMLPVFFISAFRYYVGTDYGAYQRGFFTIARGGEVNFEWLYVWINKAIAELGGGFEWVFIISSLIVLLPTYLHIFDYSPYPIMSILLLFGTTYYFGAFNGIRQLMASAILMYSMRYIEQRRPLPFAAAIVIASGFHRSSILFAIMYFTRRLKLTPYKAAIMAALLFFFADPIGDLLVSVLSGTRYGVYVDGGGRVLWTRFAIQAAVLLLASFYRDRSDRFRIYYAAEFITICCVAFGGTVDYAYRMMWTFGYSAIILVPMAIHEIRSERDRRLAAALTLACFFAYAFIVTIKLGLHDVLPYRFVFKYLK